MRGNQFKALAALCIVFLLSACGDTPEAELLASAKQYLQKQDHKAAAIQLKNVLQANPSSAQARYLLGAALFKGGDIAGAEIELRRALDLNYPKVEAAPLMAQVLLAMREYKQLTDQYAGMDLPDADASVSLQMSVAAAFAAQGALDSARSAIAKALAISPRSPVVLVAHARIKASSGDVDGALNVLEELLARSPDASEGWRLQADLLLHNKGQTAAAIASYQKALAIQPDQADLHAALITLSFVQGDQASAQRQFETMKATLPGHPLTKFYLAQLTLAKGDFLRARELMLELLRVVPDNVSVLHVAGAVELQLGALGQAETYLSRAVRQQPGFVAASRLLAEVYLRSHQPAKAIAALRGVIDKPNVDAGTLTTAGQAYLLLNDAKTADSYFARAARLKPNDAKARSALAMSQLSRGNADAAFVELQSIAAADTGVSADMALISARLRRNELDAALKAITQLEKKQPNSPVAQGLFGHVHVMRKDAAAARKSFEKALSQDARYFPAAANLAALDILDKKPDSAKARFDSFLKTNPKSVRAFLALAELKKRSGTNPEDVAKLIGDAINADPIDPQARLALIEHYASLGDFKAAITAGQAAVGSLPKDVELQDRLARVLLSGGEVNQAKSTFTKMASLHPDSSLGSLGLAEMNLASKDFAAASKSARQALALDPNSLAAQRVAIIAAMRQNRPEDASKIARLMQTQRSNEALGFILEGDIEAEQARWDLAISAFRSATLKPNPAHAPARLHYALSRAKKAADAAKFTNSWLNAHPKDTLFMLYLADTASAAGDNPQAEKYYQQVLKQQPENAIALNNVAWIMIKQKQPGAVAMAERAVKAAPGRLALVDTLAFALSSDNQHAKALELQKKVVAQAPQAPAFRLTLAKIYLQSGEKRLAQTELKELLKLGKDFPGRDEAVRLVKEAGIS